MKTKKLSFSEITGTMSRNKMKKIMAGSGGGGSCGGSNCSGNCSCTDAHNVVHDGTCHLDKGVSSGCACVCVY